MILYQDYLYIHLPKTGGTWVSHVLTQLGGRTEYGQHDPAWFPTARNLFQRRTLLGSVRHPLSWYVSLYCHCMTNTSYLPTLLHYGQGSSDFRDVLRGWLYPERIPHGPPAPIGVIWSPVGAAHSCYADSGVGLATWAVWYWYGDNQIWQTGRGDLLTENLMLTYRIQADLEYQLGTCLHEYRDPINRRDHAPVDRWYDSESRGWVAERDAWLLALWEDLVCRF